MIYGWRTSSTSVIAQPCRHRRGTLVHVEFIVEEESTAQALEILVPRIVGSDVTFRIHPFQGKRDLLRKLVPRLRGYRRSLPDDHRIAVLIDRDDATCDDEKRRLEAAAAEAGYVTKSTSTTGRFKVLNRLAIEELEAWFFGDVDALLRAFPGIPPTLAAQRPFRDPDAISGGTWEALERVLQRAGYYRTGIAKVEVARRVAEHMDPGRNRSHSFGVFCTGLQALVR